MSQISGYDKLYFQYPPDDQKCLKHRYATRIFKGLQDNTGSQQQCECCGRKIGNIQVDYNCCFSNTQLAFLGPGLPLFFSYLQASIVILLVLSIIFTAFALTTNILGGDCERTQRCTNNMFNTISIVNKADQGDFLSGQNYVLLAFVVTYVFLFQGVRYVFRKIKIDCDIISNSASDYAIILRRLPDNVTEEQIKTMVQQHIQYLSDDEKKRTQNLRIVHTFIAPNIDQYSKALEQNKKNFIQFIKQGGQSSLFNPQPLPQITQTGKIAIVVFAHQLSKEFFIYSPNTLQKLINQICTPFTPLSDFQVDGKNVSIERAPEPDDIIWQNCATGINQTICRRSIISFFSIILLFAGGAGQYGLAVFQNSIEDETYSFYISIISSLMITLMNQIILTFLVVTSTLEYYPTLTNLNTVLMKKMSLYLFLNAGIFNVAANIFANLANFSLEGDFSNEVTMIMVLNAVTPNASIFFMDYFDIVGKIKKKLYQKSCIFTPLSQMQANKLFQMPTINLPYQYGYIVKTLWLTALYCPFTPIVVPISLVGLFINYWLQKLLHSRSYRVPNMIWTTVNEAAAELLDFIPLILALGQWLLYLYFYNFNFGLIPDYWSIPIYISLGLSVLILLVPQQQINHKICKIDDQAQEDPAYEDILDQIQVTYEMVHPITKKYTKKERKRDKFLLASLFGGDRPLNEIKTQRQDTQTNAIKKALIGNYEQYNQNPYKPQNQQQINNQYYNQPSNQYQQNNYPQIDINPLSILANNNHNPQNNPNRYL